MWTFFIDSNISRLSKFLELNKAIKIWLKWQCWIRWGICPPIAAYTRKSPALRIQCTLYFDSQLHGILPWADISRNWNTFLRKLRKLNFLCSGTDWADSLSQCPYSLTRSPFFFQIEINKSLGLAIMSRFMTMQIVCTNLCLWYTIIIEETAIELSHFAESHVSEPTNTTGLNGLSYFFHI